IVPLLIAPTPESAFPDVLRGLQYVDFTDNTCQADYDSDIDDILNILRRDHDYYEQHKILLARAIKWEIENHKPAFLLRGHNLENAKTWLRLSDKREQHPPLDLHQQLITASEAAKGQLGTDVFLSYSRTDGDFARELNTTLQQAGKTTWFDQESISSGVDFEKEIFKGIDSADNFVFVISPDAVESEYCEREVDYAADNSKRFITVLHRETSPDTMPDALRKINWIDFKDTAFDKSFPELIQAIELDRAHAHQHTVLQQRASDWTENLRSADFLLNITACANAESWQQIAVGEDKQPVPTFLQRDFIVDSRVAITKANRRRNILLTSAVVGMIAAGILAVFAFVQMNKAELAKADADKQHKNAEEQAQIAENEKNRAEKQYKIAKANNLAFISTDLLENGDVTKAIRVAQAAYEINLNKMPSSVKQAMTNAYNSVAMGNNAFYQSELKQHTKGINTVHYAPNGQKILTTSDDGTAKLWDSQSVLLKDMKQGESIRGAAFSHDSSKIVTTGNGGRVKMWHGNGDYIKDLVGHRSNVANVAFSPDDQTIVTVSGDFKTGDYKAIMWDGDGNKKKELTDHSFAVIFVAFSPNGEYFVTGSYDLDRSVKLYDKNGNLIASLEKDNCHRQKHWFCGPTSAAFSHDNRSVVVTSHDSTVRIWDIEGHLKKTLNRHKQDVNKVVFSPNGSLFVTISDDKTAIIWDRDGNVVQVLTGHTAAIKSVAFSPSGKLIVTGSADHSAKLWDLNGNLLIDYTGHNLGVRSVAFSPDGQYVVTASADRTAKIWPVLKRPRSILFHHDGVKFAKFIRNDTQVLTVSSKEMTVKLWDANTAELQKTYTGFGSDKAGNKRIYSIEVSPDHKRFITTSTDYIVRIVDINSGEKVKLWNSQNVHDCNRLGWCGAKIARYSYDGKHIVTGGFGGKVRLLDSEGNFVK
ncbi:MAG: hypothetical protein DRR19_32425, partial [Candidatus Parabeggiatoa sp. nov. 1]